MLIVFVFVDFFVSFSISDQSKTKYLFLGQLWLRKVKQLISFP